MDMVPSLDLLQLTGPIILHGFPVLRTTYFLKFELFLAAFLSPGYLLCLILGDTFDGLLIADCEYW